MAITVAVADSITGTAAVITACAATTSGVCVVELTGIAATA